MPPSSQAALLAVILAVGAVRHAHAQPTGPQAEATTIERLRVDSVFTAVGEPGGPGCAVGVFRDGQTILTRGYGLADIEHRVPNARDTRFYLASMSKQFTAFAVLLLERRGALRLDDDVRRHVPDLPVFGPAITVRHLLTHTSGLREFDTLLQLSDWPGAVVNGDAHLTRRDFLTLIGRQHALNFAPGSDWLYNNTGYALLAEIVERASGMPLAVFAEREIFRPLGMTSTRFVDDHTSLVPDRAYGYARSGAGAWTLRIPLQDVVGHSGMVSTIDDLARWDRNFLHPAVGDRAMFAAMERPTHLSDGREAGYGFGLVIGTYRGHRTISHSGGWGGFNTELLRVPDAQLSVATLCNRRTPAASVLAQQVAAVFLPLARDDLASGPSRKLTTADSTLVGTYVDRATDQWVRIVLGSEVLLVTASSGARDTLVPRADGSFATDGASWRFTPSERRAPTQVTVDHSGLPPRATYERVPSPTGRTVDTTLRGKYWSDELRHHLTISHNDSAVMVRLTESNAPLRLTELYRDGYVYGPLALRFQRSTPTGAPHLLLLSLHGARRVEYRRCAAEGCPDEVRVPTTRVAPREGPALTSEGMERHR